jgi:hypothetical protein
MILSLSGLLLGVSASAAPPAPAFNVSPGLKAESPTGAAPGVVWVSPKTEGEAPVNCRGRMVTARAELGLPKLPDDGAKPGDPLFIAAVDRLADGCEMLVMRDDLSDIRPLPQFQDGPGKMIPLGGQ